MTNRDDRELIHDRNISCKGYKRSDGLWDIVGILVDIKSYSFPNKHRGEVKAGEPLHEMHMTMTVDNEFLIHDIIVETKYGPYRQCGDIVPNYEKLKGVQIKPGISRVIRSEVGGKLGCVHQTDLLKLVLTTAFQTIGPLIKNPNKTRSDKFMKNQCHVYAYDKHKE